jgi:SPP1 family predicted phage head-tail adaptor
MSQAMELNRRVTIQEATNSKDASGGNVKAWANVASIGANGTVWARVKNLSGNERRITTHGGEVAEARTEFKIRYAAGIDETMRVSYGGKVYNIKHVNDLNDGHRWIFLTCDTGANHG